MSSIRLQQLYSKNNRPAPTSRLRKFIAVCLNVSHYTWYCGESVGIFSFNEAPVSADGIFIKSLGTKFRYIRTVDLQPKSRHGFNDRSNANFGFGSAT